METFVSAAMISSLVSFAATISFGNAGAIGAMFLVLICSCVACFVHPRIKIHSCGCTGGQSGFIAAVGPLPSQECLTCVEPIQTAFYTLYIFLSIVFVAIFIYAITMQRPPLNN